MISPPLGQAAMRLFDALEKMGQSAGSGLQSGGPSGQPSQELVKAFQDAMNAQSGTGGVGGPQEISGVSERAAMTGMPGVEQISGPGPAEQMPPVDWSDAEAQATGTDLPGSQIHVTASEPGTAPVSCTDRVGQPAGVELPGAGQTDVKIEVVDSTSSPTTSPDDPTRAPADGGDTFQELGRLLEKVTSPGVSISPADIYRLQYMVGVLRVQAQTGQKVSQEATQGMESLLRQSG